MKGHIRKRGSKWVLVIDIGENTSDRRKQKWIPFDGTKKEAQEELRRVLGQIDNNQFVDPKKITLSQHLKEWLRVVDVSAKTYERYEIIVNKHLIPNLGAIRLSNLKPQDIEGYYSKALKEGRADGKGGLSKRSVLHTHRVLHAALSKAITWQLIVRNPASKEFIKPPRPDKSERLTFTTEETLDVLDKAKDNRLYVPILLAVTTGLRRGEVLGLKWSDIDMDGKRLSIRRVLEQTRISGIKVKEPKTERSIRNIALPAITVFALRQYKARQIELGLKLGTQLKDDDFIFDSPLGLLKPSQLTTAYAAFRKSHGFKHVTFHDLRHTHATHLLEKNIHPKIVSERLGHSTIAITLNTYSHVTPSMQEDAANKVDEFLKISK